MRRRGKTRRMVGGKCSCPIGVEILMISGDCYKCHLQIVHKKLKKEKENRRSVQVVCICWHNNGSSVMFWAAFDQRILFWIIGIFL